MQVSASVLLALLLLAQWAVQDRDRLAAQYPASLPLLNSLCRPLACQVGPVRRIESVVIDSSNLVRRLGNFYAFDLVLKNSAPMAVADWESAARDGVRYVADDAVFSLSRTGRREGWTG